MVLSAGIEGRTDSNGKVNSSFVGILDLIFVCLQASKMALMSTTHVEVNP